MTEQRAYLDKQQSYRRILACVRRRDWRDLPREQWAWQPGMNHRDSKVRMVSRKAKVAA